MNSRSRRGVSLAASALTLAMALTVQAAPVPHTFISQATAHAQEATQASKTNPKWEVKKANPGEEVELRNIGDEIPADANVTVSGAPEATAGYQKASKVIFADLAKRTKPGSTLNLYVHIKFSDNSQKTVNAQILILGNVHYADVELTPGESVTVSPTSGVTPDNMIARVDNPETQITADATGTNQVKITAADSAAGKSATVTVTDAAGKTYSTFKVSVKAKNNPAPQNPGSDTGNTGNPGDTGNTGNTGNTGSSNTYPNNPKCIATGLGLSIPVTLLGALGIASQVGLPGVPNVLANLQLPAAGGTGNAQIDHLLAMLNQQLANPDVQRAITAVGVLLVGIVSAVVIADTCLPGGLAGNGTAEDKS